MITFDNNLFYFLFVLLKRYGRLKNVWVSRERPGFGFVIYEDSRDAEDAVRALNGRFVVSFLDMN